MGSSSTSVALPRPDTTSASNNNEVYGEEQYHNGRQEDGHRRNEACGPVFVFVEPRSCAGKIIHFPWSIQQQHQGVALEAEGSSEEEARGGGHRGGTEHGDDDDDDDVDDLVVGRGQEDRRG